MVMRNERTPLCVLLVSLVVLAAQAKPAAAAGYSYTQDMQKTVWNEVKSAMENDRYNGAHGGGVGAALIRLLFHDCWVQGCDGSVLLDSTPYKGNNGTEKNAGSNIGLRGFEVIDAIKAKLGDSVSCADIVVFAAREATIILSGGNITYVVEAGRMDGVKSSAVEADNTLPASTFDLEQLNKNFAAKGFNQEELVVLSGAHTIGVSHFSSFQDRLNPATATPINADYQRALMKDRWSQTVAQLTMNPTEKNNIRDMDLAFRNTSGYNATGVNTAARGALDNSYYHANLQNMVLFKSDWVLRTDGDAEADLHEYKNNATAWNIDFGEGMAKLSKLLPDQGSYLEIRKDCRRTNKDYYY